MSKKEKFIETVEKLLKESNEVVEKEVYDYLETLKNQPSRAVEMTENGKNIIEYMQENIEDTDNKYLAREIGEGLFTSSRSVSGAMRKLVNDGYVDKSEDSPIVYSLTEEGIDYSIE